MNCSLRLIPLIFISCVSLSHANYMELKKGKSSIINETNELITIDYTLCDYDYNSLNKKILNETCKASSIKLEPKQLIPFTLNPMTTQNPNIMHYKKVWVKKIIDKNTVQYFISNNNDSSAYEKYADRKNPQGVDKVALYCTFFYETDAHIYPSSKGFICNRQ